MILGVSLFVAWIDMYCLIRSKSFWSCLSNDLILAWWCEASVWIIRNFLAVNNGINCSWMLLIVSFIPDIMLVTWLIFSPFSFISPLEILVTEITSSNTFFSANWLEYRSFTCCLIMSISFWSAVPKRKLNNPSNGRIDLQS